VEGNVPPLPQPHPSKLRLYLNVNLGIAQIISLGKQQVWLDGHKPQVKLSLCAINTYVKNGGIVPLILNIGTRWQQVISFTS
jgi:hypothetical protein